MSPSEYLRDICRLRIAVAYLGERSQLSWWKSSFLTLTGWRFLERLFPRTSRQAAVESAIEAAKRVHDEAIGKGGVVHLFRFDEEQEARLHDTLMTFSASDIETLCASRESAESLLRDDFPGTVVPAVGAVQVGRFDETFDGRFFTIFAQQYLAAFHSGTPVFPYLRR